MCLFLSFTCYLIILTLIFLRTFITLTTGFINLRVWSTGTLTYISLWFSICAFYEGQKICSPEFEIFLCAWKQRKKLKLKCMVWPSTEISCYLANTNRYQNCVKTVNLPKIHCTKIVKKFSFQGNIWGSKLFSIHTVDRFCSRF